MFGVLSVLDDDEASASSFSAEEVTGDTLSRSLDVTLDPSVEDDPSVEYGETRLGALTGEDRAFVGGPRVVREKTPTAQIGDSQVESIASASRVDLGLVDPSERARDPDAGETMDEDNSLSGLFGFAMASQDPTTEGPDLPSVDRLVSGRFDRLDEAAPDAADRQRDALRRAALRGRPVKETNRAQHLVAREQGVLEPAATPTRPAARSPVTHWRWVAGAVGLLAFAVAAGTAPWWSPAPRGDPALAPLPDSPEVPSLEAPVPSPTATARPLGPASADPPANTSALERATSPEPAKDPTAPKPEVSARPPRATRPTANRPEPARAKKTGAEGTIRLSCTDASELHVSTVGRFAVTPGRFEKRLPPGGYVVTLVRDGRILDRRSVRLLAGSRVDFACP